MYFFLGHFFKFLGADVNICCSLCNHKSTEPLFHTLVTCYLLVVVNFLVPSFSVILSQLYACYFRAASCRVVTRLMFCALWSLRMQNVHAFLWKSYKVPILLPLGFGLFMFSFFLHILVVEWRHILYLHNIVWIWAFRGMKHTCSYLHVILWDPCCAWIVFFPAVKGQ